MKQKVQNKGLALAIGLCCALALTQCRINDNHYLMNVDRKGVILDGYDSVAFFEEEKAVKGDSKFQAKYNDAIFYFASEKTRGFSKRVLQNMRRNLEAGAPMLYPWDMYPLLA